jgi:hypothetical protein
MRRGHPRDLKIHLFAKNCVDEFARISCESFERESLNRSNVIPEVFVTAPADGEN